MIKLQAATVYYSSMTNRLYITKKSAIDAETNAIIKKKYPSIDFYQSDLKNYNKLFRRLRRLVKRSLEGK